MAHDAEAARTRAEARFKKDDDRKREGAKAMTEHEAATRAVRERTVRLKALRLAKEAADLAAAPVPEPKKRASRSKKVLVKAAE